ncbi:MAG: hypothetical protein EA363_01025 [Balneolaceae bacterium]|nr:MAG: hypothetical protein EA363_01025 [Balneolaceae bacterium]
MFHRLFETLILLSHRAGCSIRSCSFVSLLLLFVTFATSTSLAASTMLLDEDTPERVWGIDFKGNETFPGMTLRNIIALESPSFFRKFRFWNRSGFDFDGTELRRDEIRIKRYYQRRGFPHVTVRAEVREGRRDWVRRIDFHIEEGEPTMIRSVRYELDTDDEIASWLEEQREFVRAKRRQVMQEELRYQLIEHSDVEGLFLSTLRNLGFAFAETYVTAQIDTTGRLADVLITLVPGPRTYFGEIRVDGHETVPESIVLRHSDLKAGDQFSSRKLRTAQQQIFGHPLFRFVTVNMPPQEPDSLVDINIRVREHALRSVRVQGGVGLEEIVRLSVSWTHRNPLGNAHTFSATTRASLLEQRANLDYHIPYIFNPKSRINISPFGQRRDEPGYILLRGGINNSFIYQISREAAGTVSYEFTRNREIIEASDFRLPDDKQRYNISALTFSGYYNKLEVERYQGWALRPYAEFSGLFGTGTLRYNRYSLDIRRYFNLTRSTQLAFRNEGGVISRVGDHDLPSHIRMYAGGTSSVRGWQRRQLGPKRAIFGSDGEFAEYVPVGGKSMYIFNLELRQELHMLIRHFGMAAFLDGGAVWERISDINVDDMQFGVGGGFRYQSPIGPVRIDLAYKVNPTDEDLKIFNGEDFGNWFSRWGIHFSIGQAF